MTQAYDEALKWYAKGMEDAQADGVMPQDYIGTHFYRTYSNEFPKELNQGANFEHSRTYELTVGTRYFGKMDAALIVSLLELPVGDRIKIMGISDQEIYAHLKREKETMIHALEIIFRSEWIDREWDQPIDWMDDKANNDRFGLPYTSKALLAHFRAGRLNVFDFGEQIFAFVRDELKPGVVEKSKRR